MTRRQTYGQAMASWEEEREERMWNSALNRALANKDYSEFESLIQEGIESKYEIPTFSDEIALDILKKYHL